MSEFLGIEKARFEEMEVLWICQQWISDPTLACRGGRICWRDTG